MYKKFSTSCIPTGKVMVGSTLKVINRKHNATLYIKTYPTDLGNAKIGVTSVATPLGAAVPDKSKGAEVTVRVSLGYIPYYIERVL